MIKLLSPEADAVLPLSTEAQNEFRLHSHELTSTGKIDWMHLEVKSGTPDGSLPRPVVFTWEGDDCAVLEIADNPAFADAGRYPGENGSVTVYNFRIARKYWWRVGDSEVRSFVTEDLAPRWIRVDGTTNVRDTGGWKTEDGRRVKQGLLYRGGEMNTHVFITEAGINTMVNELGIRTDLDLRGEAVGVHTESPLGVEYCLLPFAAYDDFAANPINLKEVFEILADESKYPLYYHCWGGADRTGTLAFMVGAILGIPEDDLYLDYEFTSISIWRGIRCRSGEGMQGLVQGIKPYGTNVKEQAENFLRAHGVTDEMMERIRTILLEEKED
ncbi:MAG: tyrosine-protein phosphatase [Ruminococcaceae bacterium]|nr:tyrosine-protein phosphatase [Oscillospiraceae bacterium]